jgi:hypothetical protein
MKGTVTRIGDRTAALNISASTAAGVPVMVRYTDDGTTVDISVDSADAGGVLAFGGYYPHMRGGRIQLAATQRGAGAPLAGSIAIERFRVAGDPSLTGLIQSGENQPLPQGAQNPAGQGVNASDVGFDRLNADFERHGGDLQVIDGVLRGPAVGATLEGTLNFDSKKLALHGTYLPLYALNNLFGQLPLFLGPLLGGKPNEGLLGITYSLSGTIASPVLTINPISVVAPGVFRYILGMDNPQAAQPRDPAAIGTGPTSERINR